MKEKSENEKLINIITIILLFFFYPIGLIIMWAVTSWSKTVKWVVTSLIFIPLILGILAMVVIVAINPSAQFEKARDQQRISNAEFFRSGIELYKLDKGNYPADLTDLEIGGYLSGVDAASVSDLGKPTYKVVSGGQDYELCFVLESPENFDRYNTESGEVCLKSKY